MNGYNFLELAIKDILRVINPSKEDWSVRFHIINEIRSVAESIESLRGATVEPFGSFASNLFTKWGDLDISIELQNGSYISSPGRKHKQSLLGDVLRALRKKGGFRRLQFISNARVPILKFESCYNISCDISINNLSGQMKSKMLFWINEIDGRFRDLVLLVKEWAKTHHINDSKAGTLNSYSLSLLVVFHLQTLVPPILPPLREIYPRNMVDDLTGVRAAAEKHIEDTCAVNINRIKSDKLRLINRSSLSELFISFLAKFSDVCSSASTHGISPYAGQSEDIDSNMRWLPKTYALFVEDPFEQPANTARTVSSNQLIKISDAIQETHGILTSPNQIQTSLVSVLAGEHISRLLTRTSASTPVIKSGTRNPGANHSRNGLKTRSERKQTPLQSQNKSQNKRMDKRQNDTTNGPMHASTSQKQQVWRPRSQTKVDQIGSDG
ncbi:protein HESO1 [Sesamum alatum]|uniref:Protein HESO1 n=1 Tax=Sesamum alatum TaxID=300844 RepID=A0AAE1YJX1_9LAMI|nr:protein HESO1 [Sesamum alatum]